MTYPATTETGLQLVWQAYRWTWATATPREKADWVRKHLLMPGLSHGDVCRLFNLTTHGLDLIDTGHNWSRSFERSFGANP
jgi:hypothetical protein